jgi:hypothetical protein
MKRREFFEKSGCGLLGLMMAEFGFASGQKEGVQDPKKKMSREDMVKKMLMEKMGKTEEEAGTMIKEMKEKLPMVKDMCICKTCPTFVTEETEVGFCHPLVGKSKIITEEKGCDCPKCPVYQKMSLKNGYYCTRKSEMEQEMAKKG